MNTEIQPNPMRKLAQSVGFGLARIVKFLLKIIFGVIDIVTNPVTIFIALMLLLLTGFAYSAFYNDTNLGSINSLSIGLIAAYTVLHFGLIPPDYNLPEKYHFLNVFLYNLIVLAMLVNLITWSLGVFTCNHAMWMKNMESALIVDGKPITDEGFKFINPFKQKVQRIEHNLSLINIPVKGVTKDGVPIQALVDVQLRRNDNPLHWKSLDDLNPKLDDVIRERFKIACTNVTSDQIASSGLKLEFDTGRDTSPEKTLPAAVQRDGEVVVKNIHVHFKD